MKYSSERNVQVLIALLKENGIRKAVISPGATNVTFVQSLQCDSFFELYSCVDERSAAYMACGIAAECQCPVILSCTGATASRNYYPGLTEAYYRKLPILAVTSVRDEMQVGNLIDQQLDKTIQPKDLVRASFYLRSINNEDDEWDCVVKANRAILELNHHGGGPVNIRLVTTYSRNYEVDELPKVRKIERLLFDDSFPSISSYRRIGIFIGNHRPCDDRLVKAIERFCLLHNAVVFCNPCSGYEGEKRVYYGLASTQPKTDVNCSPDLLIHLGNMSTFPWPFSSCKEVWRVCEDGEVSDPLRKLTKVFEMPEYYFFEHYSKGESIECEYYKACTKTLQSIRNTIPDLPFSNTWIAQTLSKLIPSPAELHLGILNSLRVWNLCDIPLGVNVSCNEGGYGIDGCLSTAIGASFSNPQKLHFCILGDLAFFYDMNSMGNRHISSNIRVLVVNNGRGNEFRQFTNHAYLLGDAADPYIAAAGHFGNKSKSLIRLYSESLGFRYFSASNKDQFMETLSEFLSKDLEVPMLLEVFTETVDENSALYAISNILDRDINIVESIKTGAYKLLGKKTITIAKKILDK